ncbi:MAG: hypothetical protein RJA07_453 [Bacteroidota bacterium]
MSKKAILYVRVSTDEQAEKGFSLAHQDERLRKHCEQNNIEVVDFYREDHSAKTFDRPAFTKLLEFGKKHKGQINLLLFTKWDRFSRNAGDAYGMINQLTKLGIEPQAIEQPLDLAIPENKIMLAFYLAAPEVENDRRAMNVTVGMRRAKKEGRWMGVAPKGYKNIRNEKGIASIIIDAEQGKIMRWAFEELAKGMNTVSIIWETARGKGLKCALGHFWTCLRSPVYCGLIQVPAYKDEEAQIVEGTHEPLITKEIFYQVQDLLDGRKRNSPSKNTNRNELPMRGFLNCISCGNLLTGSASKGKMGVRYFYYHCNPCGIRFRADEANKKFENKVAGITPNKLVANMIQNVISDFHESNKSNNRQENNKYVIEINKLKSRIANAQTLMLDGQLDAAEYKEIKQKIESEIQKTERFLHENRTTDSSLKEALEYLNLFIQVPQKAYSKGSLEAKQQILSSTIVSPTIFDGNDYRTLIFNDAITLYCRTVEGLKENKKDCFSKNEKQSREVDLPGFEPGCRQSRHKLSTYLVHT